MVLITKLWASCLCRTGDDWTVQGYRIGPRTVLGFDYPDS